MNLATYLLVDGYNDRYEMAIVVSNDSDLMEPVRLIQQEKGVRVAILSPQGSTRLVARDLQSVAAEFRRVKTLAPALRASQFPIELTDANGTFRKPSAW